MEKIKELRDKTGAGIVECKKALEEAGGDIARAVEILRKKGIARAAKRSGREASQGVIKLGLSDDGREGYAVEISAETDFVARNEKFQAFADLALKIVKTVKPKSLGELLGAKISEAAGERPAGPEETVRERLGSLSGTVGEKMELKRFDILASAGTVEAYSHMDGKIGVLVALNRPGRGELAHDIALQIAAANPRYIHPEEVPEEEIEKEKEIYREQLRREGKPENMLDRIMAGKLDKYFEEVCLVRQEYIKDDKKKVKEALGDTEVEKFIRYSL